jgi:butyryl-CoA dehydrogenase
MAEKFISERNLKFLLNEVFDTPALVRHPYYAEHSPETLDMVLDTAVKMARDTLKPCFTEMDRNPPVFADGKVRVHPMVREILRQFGEGGWISAMASTEHGGQQLPMIVVMATHFIFGAANYSASIYPSACTGAAHLITSFGTPAQIATYVPKLYAGEWQGTMALTEPQAGSSLADITTTAEPTAEGDYRIKGQKIFISASEHDGADNIINLMLAKIKGAPAGVKGISLFIVPNKRPDGAGNLVPNDVTVTATYHKLGYRGTPINQLSLGDNDDCRGELVGLPHKGLSYMFQMMNEARLHVGIGATAIASAAYYAALEYTKARPQGRRLTDRNPLSPQIPIIEHADVKRMLLFQRAIVEGSLALLLQCSRYADLSLVAPDEEKERAALLLDLLTPVAKTYPAEMGILSTSQGLQCLGGYGYCEEFPLEQHFRDARIHPIHEGTTAIHGLLLLARNVTMQNGRAFTLFLEEVGKVIAATETDEVLKPCARQLAEAIERLKDVTHHLLGLAMKGSIDLFLADATLYIECFGIVAVAWQWLVQAQVARTALARGPAADEANFYQGKLYAFRYFFGYELPKIAGLATRLLNSDGLTVEMKEDFFND